MTGRANQNQAGWRVTAAEIERSVATAARTILEDHTAIAADIEQSDLDGQQTKSILDAASAWSNRLRSETEAADAMELVDRVELHQDGIRLAIKLPIECSEKLAR